MTSDQKRKRGRPPGASRLEPDASSHEAPDHDAEPDAEERARPKKRGRKGDTESPNIVPGPAQDANGQAQPPRVGRPKKSQQSATADVHHETEGQDPRAEADKTARHSKRAVPLQGKGKGAPTTVPREEQQPQSTEPGRTGRARGASSRDTSNSKQPVSSPDMSTERVSKRAGGASAATLKGQGKALAGKQKETANRASPTDDEPSAPAPRRRRGRPTRESDSLPSRSRKGGKREAQTTEATDNRKSGARTNRASQELASPEVHQNAPAAKAGEKKKRRGRPSLNKEEPQSAHVLQPQKGNRSKAPRRSPEADKTSGDSHSTEEASGQMRRGRLRRSDTVSQDPVSAQPPRSRGRPRREPEPTEDQEQEQEQASTRTERGKRQPPRLEQVVEEDEGEDEGEDASSEDEQDFPFRYLRESTKYISRSVISEKWDALDGPSITAVGTFLADAQRPVLLRLQNTSRRREHAAAALAAVSRRLHSKLVKGLPFPAPTARPTRRAGAGSHVDEFDLERSMNAVQGLENTLNPLLHSISLLGREIRKEEDALSRDYDSLHKLEANARSEAKGWRDKAKREHVLASGIRRKDEESGYDDGGDRLELVVKPEDAATGGIFKELDDEELVTISRQIGSHMESMQGNLHQVDAVVPAIGKSKAALQQLMQKHLDEEQYDKVLLG